MSHYLTFKLTGFKELKLTKSLQISNLLFTIFCENFEMKVATAMPNFNLLRWEIAKVLKPKHKAL